MASRQNYTYDSIVFKNITYYNIRVKSILKKNNGSADIVGFYGNRSAKRGHGETRIAKVFLARGGLKGRAVYPCEDR